MDNLNLLEIWKSIDAKILFTAVLLPALAAYISGRFGVRRGLEQARRQRAFDRSVEWHESTLSATNRFRLVSRQYADALFAYSSFRSGEPITNVAKQVEECLSDLEKRLFEAVLFADRKVIRRLRALARSTTKNDIILIAGDVAGGRRSDGSATLLLKELQALEPDVDAIQLALIDEFRKTLGLNKLTHSEFGIYPDPPRNRIREFLLARFPKVGKLFPRMFPTLDKST